MLGIISKVKYIQSMYLNILNREGVSETFLQLMLKKILSVSLKKGILWESFIKDYVYIKMLIQAAKLRSIIT